MCEKRISDKPKEVLSAVNEVKSTSQAAEMNEHVDPSVKKRSLSNYLSNVNLRREELEKLKKRQDEEKQQLAVQQEQLKQEEQEREKERLVKEQREQEALRRKEDQQKKTVPTEQAEIKENDIPQQAAVKDNESNLRSLDLNVEERRRSIPGDKVGDAVNTFKDHNSPQPGTSYNAQEIEKPKSETISRDDLHAMLKEPKIRRSGVVAGDNCEDEGAIDKEPKKEELSEEEIASDAPTEPASPPKPRRRRLIRGDRLSSLSPRHSTFDNESDSELSDIDELKSLQISSSFIHGDSSPVRDSHDSRHRYHQPSSPRLVRRSTSPGRAKHHIAVPKASKQKKGIYRDAGGRTRLQISCDKGNYEQAKKLIEEEGYDVNDQDNAGNTALHEAALNGHLDIVKLLIENGADVNMQSFEMFKDTPLIDASANGHLDVVKYLLSHGADPTICNAKGLTAFESIEDSDLDEQERDIVHEIKRNLRSAARNWKDEKAVPGVLNKKDKHLKNQSQLSQRSEELLGDFEFFWTDITSRAGKEKLFKASKEGKLSYVGAYLENGGKIDLKSFFEAVKFGHEDIVSLFLAFGAPVNAVSKNGTTALICAVGRGHVGTVKLLLEAGADPSKKDKNGHTASHYAENSPMGVVNTEEIELLEQAIKKSSSHVTSKEKCIKKSPEQAHVQEKTIINRQEDITDNHKDHEDDENVISIARKRRTVSPDRLENKRQTLLSEILSPEAIEPREAVSPQNIRDSKTSETSTPELESVKIPEQTPEEKEQRLKAEEEYIQRRLLNKRRKEQELLRKLALDEEKREKERAQQKIEEAKKLQERERLKQIELENKNKEAELVRRREIRSLYPIGLRLVDFNNADDYHDYLPLYFAQVGEDGSKYVLDLQVCVILKDTNFLYNEHNIQNNIPVQLKHKRQLWNIMKFIFLNGGKNAFDWNSCSLQDRIQFELQEYKKFSNLPLQWIKLQDICISDVSKRQQIEQGIVQIVLTDNIDEAWDIPTAKELAIETVQPHFLPNKFQKRHTVTHILQNHKTQPLW